MLIITCYLNWPSSVFREAKAPCSFLSNSGRHFICITVISKARLDPYSLCTVIHQVGKIISIKNKLETRDDMKHHQQWRMETYSWREKRLYLRALHTDTVEFVLKTKLRIHTDIWMIHQCKNKPCLHFCEPDANVSMLTFSQHFSSQPLSMKNSDSIDNRI